MTSSSLTPMQQYLARMPQSNSNMTLTVASSLYPNNSSSHIEDTYHNTNQQQQQQQHSAFNGPKAVSPSPSCNRIENDNNSDPMDESEQPIPTAPTTISSSFTDNRRMSLFDAYALQQKKQHQMDLNMSMWGSIENYYD